MEQIEEDKFGFARSELLQMNFVLGVANLKYANTIIGCTTAEQESG